MKAACPAFILLLGGRRWEYKGNSRASLAQPPRFFLLSGRAPGEGLEEWLDNGDGDADGDDHELFKVRSGPDISPCAVGDGEEEDGFLVKPSEGDGRKLRNTGDLLIALAEMEREIGIPSSPTASQAPSPGSLSVADAVNTVSAYARRYKIPPKAKQARKKAQEDEMKNSSWSWFDGIEEPDNPAIFPPSFHAEATKISEGWSPEEIDELGLVREGVPSALRKPLILSRPSQKIQDKWVDPIYRETVLKKREATLRKKEENAGAESKSSKPKRLETGKAKELDYILGQSDLAVDEAMNYLKKHKEGEKRRVEKLKHRYNDPNAWMAERLENGEKAWPLLNGEEMLIEKQRKRKQNALRAWKTRRDSKPDQGSKPNTKREAGSSKT